MSDVPCTGVTISNPMAWSLKKIMKSINNTDIPTKSKRSRSKNSSKSEEQEDSDKNNVIKVIDEEVKKMKVLLMSSNVNDRGNQAKYMNYSPLAYAVMKKQYKLAEYILNFIDEERINWQCTFENESLLHIMIRNSNNISFMKKLLEKGISPNGCENQHYTPVELSILKNKCDMLKLLLKNGAESSQQEDSPHSAFSLAIGEKNNKVLDILLENAIDEYSTWGDWDKNALLQTIYYGYMYHDNQSDTDAKMEKNYEYLKKRLDILLEKQLRRKVAFAKSDRVPSDVVKTEIFSFFNGGGKTKKNRKMVRI